MTTKAEVLDARKQYEQLAEAYLRQLGATLDAQGFWMLPDGKYARYDLHTAVKIATEQYDREEPRP
jgi:hypothetical protein